LGAVAPAQAIPRFAHRYGLTCQACHTEVPHLNAFGAKFLSRHVPLHCHILDHEDGGMMAKIVVQ
jgi:hypothetical protein